MIRRWSRLNEFSFFTKKHTPVLTRFKMFKLLRALNFRRFTLIFSKFKRRKLASFKRRANWVLYSQIIKFWIRDYVFSKKLTRAQYVFGIFFYNYNSFDCFYTKKKNIFNLNISLDFFSAPFTKIFYLYFLKNFSNFFFYNNFSIYKNFNLIALSSNKEIKNLQNDNILFLSQKYEFLSYNNDIIENKKKFLLNFFFINTFTYEYFYSFYKIFNFFFINILFNVK